MNAFWVLLLAASAVTQQTCAESEYTITEEIQEKISNITKFEAGDLLKVADAVETFKLIQGNLYGLLNVPHFERWAQYGVSLTDQLWEIKQLIYDTRIIKMHLKSAKNVIYSAEDHIRVVDTFETEFEVVKDYLDSATADGFNTTVMRKLKTARDELKTLVAKCEPANILEPRLAANFTSNLNKWERIINSDEIFDLKVENFAEFPLYAYRSTAGYPECETGHTMQGGLCYLDCPPNSTGIMGHCFEDCRKKNDSALCIKTRTVLNRGSGELPKCEEGDDPVKTYALNDTNATVIACMKPCSAGFVQNPYNNHVCTQPSPDDFQDIAIGPEHVVASLKTKMDYTVGNTSEVKYVFGLPKCKQGFRRRLDNPFECTQKCPENTIDVGKSCMKVNEPRKLAIPTACRPDFELVGDRCFPICPPGFHGVLNACVPNCEPSEEIKNWHETSPFLGTVIIQETLETDAIEYKDSSYPVQGHNDNVPDGRNIPYFRQSILPTNSPKLLSAATHPKQLCARSLINRTDTVDFLNNPNTPFGLLPDSCPEDSELIPGYPSCYLNCSSRDQYENVPGTNLCVKHQDLEIVTMRKLKLAVSLYKRIMATFPPESYNSETPPNLVRKIYTHNTTRVLYNDWRNGSKGGVHRANISKIKVYVPKWNETHLGRWSPSERLFSDISRLTTRVQEGIRIAFSAAMQMARDQLEAGMPAKKFGRRGKNNYYETFEYKLLNFALVFSNAIRFKKVHLWKNGQQPSTTKSITTSGAVIELSSASDAFHKWPCFEHMQNPGYAVRGWEFIQKGTDERIIEFRLQTMYRYDNLKDHRCSITMEVLLNNASNSNQTIPCKDAKLSFNYTACNATVPCSKLEIVLRGPIFEDTNRGNKKMVPVRSPEPGCHHALCSVVSFDQLFGGLRDCEEEEECEKIIEKIRLVTKNGTFVAADTSCADPLFETRDIANAINLANESEDKTNMVNSSFLMEMHDTNITFPDLAPKILRCRSPELSPLDYVSPSPSIMNIPYPNDFYDENVMAYLITRQAYAATIVETTPSAIDEKRHDLGNLEFDKDYITLHKNFQYAYNACINDTAKRFILPHQCAWMTYKNSSCLTVDKADISECTGVSGVEKARKFQRMNTRMKDVFANMPEQMAARDILSLLRFHPGAYALGMSKLNLFPAAENFGKMKLIGGS